jgi:hypothetical protein
LNTIPPPSLKAAAKMQAVTFNILSLKKTAIKFNFAILKKQPPYLEKVLLKMNINLFKILFFISLSVYNGYSTTITASQATVVID